MANGDARIALNVLEVSVTLTPAAGGARRVTEASIREAAQRRTLAQWNERLHARRRRNFPALGDPTPTTISFTFTRTIDPYETFYYFVPRSGPRSSWPASSLLGYINLLY